MGRHSKLPHSFLHTFFSSGPHFPCDTFVLCLNRALPGIPFSLFLSQPFFFFFSFSPQIDALAGGAGRERSAEDQAGGTHVGGGSAEEASATRSAAAPLRSKFTQVNRFLLVCLFFLPLINNLVNCVLQQLHPLFQVWQVKLNGLGRGGGWCKAVFDWSLLGP